MNQEVQHQEQVAELARHLADIVTKQPTHRAALEALISTYVAVAICHPCCAQQAANTARRCAELIETRAALAGPNHVH